MTIQVSTQLRQGYSVGAPWPEVVEYVKAAEKIGIATIWAAEAWNHDALTPLAYLASQTETVRLGTGILQVGTRTPALVATSAMTIAEMSNNRFVLGLGVSGPQVIENWHGIEFRRPYARLHETVEIVKMISAGQYLDFSGEHYNIPLDPTARKIRTFLEPRKIPIYIASMGPKALELTGQIADGWAGGTFIPETAEIFFEPLKRGLTTVGRNLSDIDLQVAVTFYADKDEERALAAAKRDFAFRTGSMGSAQKNVYNESYIRQGFEDEINAVEALWRSGKRDEAAAAVSDDLMYKTCLIGSTKRIRERIQAYADAGINTLNIKPVANDMASQIDALDQVFSIVAEVTRAG